MSKIFYKTKLKWHSFLKSYNEILVEDCLCQNLKSQLKEKAQYHQLQKTKLIMKVQ